jgi:hypothetical protein
VAPDQLLSTVNALANAIKATREARTEQDLVNAENQLRTAREQMAATCGAAGGPLCDSARQIQSM